MSRTRGDIENAVDTNLLQRICIRLRISAKEVWPVAAEFTAAKARIRQLNLLLETGCLIDVIHRERPAAEETEIYANLSRFAKVIILVSIPPIERPRP